MSCHVLPRHVNTPQPQRRHHHRPLSREDLASVEGKDNADLCGHVWYGKWTMGRMIQFYTASPYDYAKGRLRKWLKARA